MDEIFNKVAMDLEAIKSCLPHRSPLLLLDIVHEIDPGNEIIASKFLTPEEPVFAGHFPNNPIYPGVYYIEAVAQAGAILTFTTLEARGQKVERMGLLTSVQEARFRQPATAGDRILYKVCIEKMRGHFVWLKGSAMNGNTILAECKLTIAVGLNKSK